MDGDFIIDDTQAALNLVNDMDPQQPAEFLLKAITYCIIGYQKKSVSFDNFATFFSTVVF